MQNECSIKGCMKCAIKDWCDHPMDTNLQKTTYWDVNKGASCYRLNHSEVTFGPKTFYEKKHFAAYGDWYMISVDDFISRCTEGGGDELVAVSLDAIL